MQKMLWIQLQNEVRVVIRWHHRSLQIRTRTGPTLCSYAAPEVDLEASAAAEPPHVSGSSAMKVVECVEVPLPS